VDLSKGTFRLALLMGAVGAVFGGYGSFSGVQTVLLHNEFISIEASRPVREESRKYAAEVQRESADNKAKQEWYSSQFASLDRKSAVDSAPRIRYQQREALVASATNSLIAHDARMREIERLHSELNRWGIKTIHWTKDFGVESIETEDGQTLYPTPAPSAWLYLRIALFPIVGFLVPWGAIRAIGWVTAGFFQPSE